MDEDLQRLARDGPPLLYARGLERLGRTDEALDALIPSRDDPEVRAAIARWPSFDRPIRGEPRLLWSVPLVDGASQPIVGIFDANPLGVTLTVIGARSGRSRDLVLDADTGAVRHAVEGSPWASARGVRLAIHVVRDDVPVERDDGVKVRAKVQALVAHDLWSGELLHDTELAPDHAVRALRSETLVVSEGNGPAAQRDGRLLLLEMPFADPRRSPGAARIIASVPSERGCPTSIRHAGRTMLVKMLQRDASDRRSERWLAIDERGSVVWSRQGSAHVLGDELGWLTGSRIGGSLTLACFDPDGTHRWSLPWRSPALVTTDRVFASCESMRSVSIVNRASGGILRELEAHAHFVIARARETVLIGRTGSVEAVTLEGETLWRSEVPGRVMGLSVGHGRVCGVTDSGVAFCLAEVKP